MTPARRRATVAALVCLLAFLVYRDSPVRTTDARGPSGRSPMVVGYLPEEAPVRGDVAALFVSLVVLSVLLASRAVLSEAWSVAVALLAAFATPLWSTASRGLGRGTWAVLFMGVSALLVVRGRTPASRVLAAVAGLAGLAVMGGGPPGLARSPVEAGSALAAALVSPSRGLLVLTPAVAIALGWAVRYRRSLWPQAPFAVATVVTVAMLARLALFPSWQDRPLYGPGETIEIVPWLAVVAAFSLRARLDDPRRAHAAVRIAAGLAVAWSVFVHGHPGWSLAPWEWNAYPVSVAEERGRLWDWGQAQPLAGLLRRPLPRYVRSLDPPALVRFGAGDERPFLWWGWGDPEPTHRWTEGERAEAVLGLPRAEPLILELRGWPYLVGGRVTAQRVLVDFNRRAIGQLALTNSGSATFRMAFQEGAVRGRNVLTLGTPDAVSPLELGLAGDAHRRAIAVQSIALRPFPVLETGARVAFADDAADAFLVEGWAPAEEGFRWTIARAAGLAFSVRTPGPHVLLLRARPFVVPGRLPTQTVVALVDGSETRRWALSANDAVELAVELGGGAAHVVTLRLLNASSPVAIGFNADRRRLGLAVESMELRAASPP